MYVDKDKFIWYICIDGLDCSGKETFAKQVTSLTNEAFKQAKMDENVKVHLLSFPDYTTESGKQIKEMLQTDVKHRDNDKLVNLFAINRSEALSKIEYTKYNIIIFDRFATSNIIYGMLPYVIKAGFERTYETDTMFYKLCKAAEKECIDSHIEIDKLVMFSRFGSESSARRHEAMLAKKENKDANERPAIQKYLSGIIDMYFNEDIIEEIWKNKNDDAMSTMINLGIDEMIRVKIGYTFSMSRSLKIIDAIVKMIDSTLTLTTGHTLLNKGVYQ